jgi:hypothetical protein
MRFVILALALISGSCFAKDVAVPKVEGPVPVTATSQIYGHAWNIDLAKAGYTEEEYFVSGKANVYQYDAKGDVAVRSPEAPYTTRLLVRRPTDPKKFSGNVVVEIINMSRGWDLDVQWQMQHEYILRNGDAYVGVTSKPDAVKALQHFDPARYGKLSWANPVPVGDPRNCTSINTILAGDSSRETENGLFYDIYSQVAALLKSADPKRPLHELPVKYSYAVGYSQSGGLLKTYIEAIEPQALFHGKPVYDGYLVGAASGPAPINQCAPGPHGLDGRLSSKPLPPRAVPVIVVMTNTDYMWSYAARRPDGDSPTDKFRLYEVAGASHGYTYPGQFEPGVEDIHRAGFDNRYAYQCAAPREGSDFRSDYIFNVALKDLDLWVRYGTAPPRSQLIEVANVGPPEPVAKRDRYGNAVGGVRTPFLEVPTATYFPEGIMDTDKGVKCTMSKQPFDHAQLQKLYPTHAAYVQKVDRSADRLVKEGWLLPEDAQQIKAQAAAAAIP